MSKVKSKKTKRDNEKDTEIIDISEDSEFKEGPEVIKIVKIGYFVGRSDPERERATDAGIDLRIPVKVLIPHGDFKCIPMGILTEIPLGYFGFLQMRSGLASKQGLICTGNVIDSGYRGEIHATIINMSRGDVYLQAGERIVQLILCKIANPIIHFAKEEELSVSERGKDGFGSSGKL